MPLLHYKSLIKAKNADSKLTLQVCHTLLVGKDLATQACLDGSSSCELKKSLPPSVDIFSHSDLLIDIAVTSNKHRLSEESTKHSTVARHLIQVLRRNASVLGINNVSDAYVDETNGQVKVNVTPARSVPQANSRLQLSLVSISLSYHYKTTPINYSSKSDPPGLGCSLELLNQVLTNFIGNHLIKRYPLIFGPLCEKLEHEKPYFRSTARSLLAMAHRSTNDTFRTQARRYTRILRRRLREYQLRVINELQGLTDRHSGLNALLIENIYKEMPDESVICEAMYRLFRLTLRPSFVRCTPVSEDLMYACDDGRRSSALLYEDDEYESTVDADDEMYCSEFEDMATYKEGSWALMSRPPTQIGIGSDLCDGTEDNLLYTQFVAYTAETSSSRIQSPEYITSGIGSKSTQDRSGPYDTDSESLIIAVLEENSSLTLGLKHGLDSRASSITLCSSDHELDGRGTPLSNPSDPQSRNHEIGHQGDEFPCTSSPDQDASQSFSRCIGIALEPASLRFSAADQELGFDNDDFSPFEHPAVDKDELITGSTGQLPTDMSKSNLLSRSVPSGSIPMAEIPALSLPFATTVDRDTNNPGLDFSDDEEEGEDRSIWGHATRGRTFSISHTSPSQGSHTSGPVPRTVLVASPLEKVDESDDQLRYPEGISPSWEVGPMELDGVFDIAMHDYNYEHDGDLGLESEDGLDEIWEGPMLQGCTVSSGRTGGVEMDRISDSEDDEEDGECRWGLVVE